MYFHLHSSKFSHGRTTTTTQKVIKQKKHTQHIFAKLSTTQLTSSQKKKSVKKQRKSEYGAKECLSDYLGFKENELQSLEKTYKAVFALLPDTLLEKLQVLEELLRFKRKADFQSALLGQFNVLSASVDRLLDTFQFLNVDYGVGLPILRKNLRLLSQSRETLERQFETLTSLGFKNPIQLLKKNSWLVSLRPESITQTFKVIEDCFGAQKARKLVDQYPQILSTSEERIQLSMQNLMILFGTETAMRKAVEQEPRLLTQSDGKLDAMSAFFADLGIDIDYLMQKYPLILKYNADSLRSKVAYLVSLFSCEESKIKQMLCKNPRVLTSSEVRYQQSYDWFIKMGFTVEQTENIFVACSDLLFIDVGSFDRNWNVLSREGLSDDQIREIIIKFPWNLYKNLDGETQQQKLRFLNKFAEGGSRAVLLKELLVLLL